MATVYVKAASKKAIKEGLANGQRFRCVDHSIFNPLPVNNLAECPVGTVVKIYRKEVGGSPYAHAYGTVKVVNGLVTIV